MTGHSWYPRPARVQAARERKAHELAELQAAPPPICNNALTLNFPTYMSIAHYPGIVVGLEYERFVNKRGTLSLGLAFQRYWAGTLAAGELSNGEERANIQGMYFMPGVFYHPAGNIEKATISLGAVFPLGSLRRYDAKANAFGTTIYTAPSSHRLAAALLQLSLRVPDHRFLFVMSLSAGPMLTAGETRGALWLFSLRFGGRF